jgi:hypothetical protein
MADRMSTRLRYDRIRDNGAISRAVNGEKKRKERANRDERMKKLIAGGKYPYTPAVQSWLSVQLGLPFSQISEEQAMAAAK